MKSVQKKSRKKSIFLRIALLAFSVYVLGSLYQLQQDIKEKRQQADVLDQQIAEMENTIGELDRRNENDEQSYEQSAYEQGYAYENDEIYKFR